jgi:hypothetical protein
MNYAVMYVQSQERVAAAREQNVCVHLMMRNWRNRLKNFPVVEW